MTERADIKQTLEAISGEYARRLGNPAIAYAHPLAEQARAFADAKEVTFISLDWLPAALLRGRGYTNAIRQHAGHEGDDAFVKLRLRRAEALQAMMRLGFLKITAVIGSDLPEKIFNNDPAATHAANQELVELANSYPEGFLPYLLKSRGEGENERGPLPAVLEGVGAVTVLTMTDGSFRVWRELSDSNAEGAFKEISATEERDQFLEVIRQLVPVEGGVPVEDSLVQDVATTVGRLHTALPAA